ncbi:MAG: hypothetical protein VKJ24_11130 [Synechococcales bacterium]|nr:hypothetical protein [Synechococcales bacterium]
MLEHRSLEPIQINHQTIDWEICFGIAVEVNKYNDNIYAGNGYPIRSQYAQGHLMITELTIRQSNGEEHDITIQGSNNLRVRDGQRVSILSGYTTSGRKCELVFVNHDRHKKYWLVKPHSFFERLRIFDHLAKRSSNFFRGMIIICALLFIFLRITSKISGLELFVFLILLGLMGFIFCLANAWIHHYQMRSAWKTIEPQILARVSQFMDEFILR